MIKYNLTEKQLKIIHDTISELQSCNENERSNCKNENIRLFKDNDSNIYMSYLNTFYGPDGTQIEMIYIMFDPTGKQSVLNFKYKSKIDLVELFEKLEPISL